MMTRKGILLLAAGVALALAGVAAASLPLTILGLALGLALLSGALVSRFPVLGGSRRIAVERMFEGDSVEVRLTVRNPGARPALVEVAEELSPSLAVEGASPHTLAIPGGGNASVDYSLTAPIRGHYELPSTRYRMTDLFDNLAEEGRFGESRYVSVFPKRSELRDMPSRSRYPMGLMGEHNVQQPGQGTEFFGLREYLPGDPMRIVNWKASARGGSDSLVVNQREKETVAEVTLLVDARRITGRGTIGNNPLLHTCRAAATVATLYLGRKDKVRVVAYGDRLRDVAFDTGERQLYKVLTLLAEVAPAGDMPAATAVDRIVGTLRPRSPVIIASSLEADPSLTEAVSLLQSLSIPVVVVTPSPLHSLAPDVSDAERAEVAAEREEMLARLRSYGAKVIDAAPDTNLQESLMVVGKK